MIPEFFRIFWSFLVFVSLDIKIRASWNKKESFWDVFVKHTLRIQNKALSSSQKECVKHTLKSGLALAQHLGMGFIGSRLKPKLPG